MDPQTDSPRKKLIYSLSLGIALSLAVGTPAAGRLIAAARPRGPGAGISRNHFMKNATAGGLEGLRGAWAEA